MNLAPLVLLCVAGSMGAAGQVVGAGATFPAPLYQRWLDSFQTSHAGMTIRYEAVGSTEGLKRLRAGTVDFAASDIPLSEAMRAGFDVPVVELPTVTGAVVPVYHVPGIRKSLQFTPEMLAEIYLGRIRMWNDPMLEAANHGVKLPAEAIRVMHRESGSGTTFVWTALLSRGSADWKPGIAWPVGQAAEGNAGMAAMVNSTEYSLGYTEFIYAVENRLSYGAVRNQAGKFIEPSTDSIRAGAANSNAAEAYPVVATTYFVIPAKARDAAKRTRLSEFLEWALDKGQNQAAGLGFVPLPEETLAKAKATLKSLAAAP